MSKVVPALGLSVMVLLAGCSHTTYHADTRATESEQAMQPDTATPAQQETRRHVELTPSLLFELMSAELAHQRGQMTQAAQTYLHAAQTTQDPRVARRATHLSLYAGQQALALEAAQLWVALDPDDIDAQQSVSALLIRTGNLDQAYPHLERVLKHNPKGLSYGLSVTTSLLSREDKPARALSALEQLTASGVPPEDALYAHAQLAKQLGLNNLATQDLEQLIGEYGESKSALILYSQVLLSQGNEAGALERLGRAVELDPDDAKLRLSYARLLVDQDELPKARRQFRVLMERSPHNADVLYASGLLAMQAKDYAEAEKLFQRLLTTRQRTDEAYFSLGEIALQKEQPEQAISWFESVTEGPNYLDARLRATLIIKQQQGLDSARAYLHQIKVSSESDSVRVLLVEAELVKEDTLPEEAMLLYNDALARYPDNIKLLFARAMLSEQLNHLEMMERDIHSILKQEPNNAQALNAWGYTLADRTNRYQEAFDYISRALQQLPDDPAIIDSMGWVLYRLGRYEESLKYLQKAAAMQQDGEIAAHLGEVLWQMGRKEEAQKIWNEALDFAPDHAILLRVIKRFSE